MKYDNRTNGILLGMCTVHIIIFKTIFHAFVNSSTLLPHAASNGAYSYIGYTYICSTVVGTFVVSTVYT